MRCAPGSLMTRAIATHPALTLRARPLRPALLTGHSSRRRRVPSGGRGRGPRRGHPLGKFSKNRYAVPTSMFNPKPGSVWANQGWRPIVVVVDSRPLIETRSAVDADLVWFTSRWEDWESFSRLGEFFHASGWIYIGSIGKIVAGLRALTPRD